MNKFTRLLALLLVLALCVGLTACASAPKTETVTQTPVKTATVVPTEKATAEPTVEATQEATGQTTVEEAAVEATAVENEVAAEEPDLKLLTINGEEVYASAVQEMAQLLYEYGYISSADDYYTALTYMISTHVEEAQIKKMGLDQFTQEEIDAFTVEAQTEYDALLEEWVAYYQTSENPTEEETDELYASTAEYFASQGYTVEALVEDYKYSASFDKLVEWMEENFDVAVTEEEVRASFEQGAEQDRQSYENNVPTYEMYTTYYGVESWYTPEGYRGILQILLEVDEELLNEYTSKLAAYEEQLSVETAEEATADDTATAEPTTEPVTLEQVEAARAAALASRQDTIDEIYARLENGEAFVDLIPEYNTDPGMNSEEARQEGYMVHKESFMDEAFLDAVFSEKMQQPGDVSEPSLGMYGIYITYFLRDIPSGTVELTDEIYGEIESSLANEKLSVLYDELLNKWSAECEIAYEADHLLQFAGLIVDENGKLMPPVMDEEIPEEE